MHNLYTAWVVSENPYTYKEESRILFRQKKNSPSAYNTARIQYLHYMSMSSMKVNYAGPYNRELTKLKVELVLIETQLVYT